MTDEEVLAVILVAASGFLLFLGAITLCIIVNHVNTKTKKMHSDWEIPMSQRNLHYFNYALEHDGIHQPNHHHNQAQGNTKPSYDPHRAEWPTNYNMYTVSHSHAFPKTGNTGVHDNQSYPNNSASSKNQDMNHKTFSVELFEGSNHSTKSAATKPDLEKPNQKRGSSSPSKSQVNEHGTWIYSTSRNERSPSETTSQHSLGRRSSTTASTVSHHREYYPSSEHQPSNYSIFKSFNVYISPDGKLSAPESNQTNTKSVTPQRQKIDYDTVHSSGNEKVFTFNIK